MIESKAPSQNTGKATFEFNVLSVNPNAQLPNTQFTVNLTYQAPRHNVAGGHFIPNLSLAGLVLLQQGTQFTHVGITVYVEEDEQTPACITELWPMNEYVPARRCITESQRPLQHLFHAEGDKVEFSGLLQRVSPSLADSLRTHIGPGVPETLRRVFWSESEIARIEANAIAQQRYEKLAQELIDSLYD